MPFEKGKPKTGGKKKGVPNKVTTDFKQALNNLLEYCAPEMVGWIKQVAKDDPNKALEHMSKLAEYIYPKLARTENKTTLDGEIIQKIERVIVRPANTNT
ncbi:hypothetical protein E6Q11_01090 [Candidatus Dojkabacteria bacterium]|uniref:Uncharacterized protein n=1 Tax=Candidatus Dojkabacteria bacterium TaxID=2099670 RepID=A0A5C7JAE4_9BACT|nr:MAG: hypothetical protein E6Q11_01090 [Candidatus Dojkabacteria bacterium]